MTTLAALSLLIWLYLLLAHGRFWQSGPELAPARPAAAPPVAVVVPARDEAPLIGQTLRSLLAQDYAGPLRVILVDDGSSDGTGAIARAHRRPAPRSCSTAQPRPAGWSGKLWAVAQGLAEAGAADLVLLTDADIVHDPRHRRDAGRAGGARRSRSGVGDGDAGLRHAGRARAGAGLRVLLPVALPVRLGERSAARHGGGGRRHHPDPPPRACSASAGWRRCAAR